MLKPIKLANKNFLSSLDIKSEEFFHILEIAKNFKNRDLVDDAHETALNILRNNLPLLESISQKILKEEVIEGEDLKNLLAESKMPA